jgi:hypothetical protein
VRIIKSIELLIFVGLVTFILLNLSCSESTNPNDKNFVLPESNLSFYDDIEPLFNARCGLESDCHSPTNIDNRLLYNDLISRNGIVYHQLSSGEQLVVVEIDSINPQNSVLFLILSEGYPDYNDLMPPFPRDKLNSNQLLGTKQWIREGAPE